MGFLGWYLVIGFVVLFFLSIYLQGLQVDAKLKEHLSIAFGGVVVLFLWPMLLGFVLVSFLVRRRSVENKE